jgi:hypothetical protein
MNLIPRHLAGEVARTLQTSRVLNIVGPRRTGKTTLVKDMLQAARFLTLDDEALLSSLALDPFGQLTAVAAEAADAGLGYNNGIMGARSQTARAVNRAYAVPV